MPHDDCGFKALLKPIQDITRNWDVDLCQHLEEYLTHIQIAVGQNLVSMNFAEAAYLLQNSANIYSKKVDGLWRFVIQLVEALGKSKQAQNEEGEGENGETGGPQNKKRRTPNTLPTDDLLYIESVCAKQSLDVKPKANATDAEKKQKIVLNAATKGKPKESVSTWIYDESNEPIGKKEEFRLHWRVLASGILQEEFINEHNRSRKRDLNYDDDVVDAGCDSFSMPFDDLPPQDDHEDQQLDLAPTDDVPLPTLPTDADFNNSTEFVREREQIFGAGQKREKCRENIVDLVDVKRKAWEPIVFDQNMPEKALRKRKLKTPEVLDESNNKKEKRKRKMCEMDKQSSSYLVIDWMLEQYVKSSKVDGYLHEIAFLTLLKTERQLKKQIQLRRRRSYNELVINRATRKQIGDFAGFEEMDPESDDDDAGGFQGFIEDNYDNDNDHMEPFVPLPNVTTDNDARLQEGSYENEALKTIKAYQQRDLEREASELTSLSERVSLWHRLIRPKLLIAEKRSAFQIHEYGTRILSKFPSDDSVIQFANVVTGLPREEVSRNFLATLCLGNTYNVELIKTDDREMAMDCLNLRLLSRVRHHEEMHENMIQNQTS